MSAYLTPEEFFRIAIRGAMFKDMDPTAITDLLQGASDMADSYFRKRFTLPMVTVGSDVKRQVAAIAAYDAIAHRGYRPDSGNDPAIETRYEKAIEWFESVANGLVEPNVVDSTPMVDEDGPQASRGGGAANFNLTTGRRRCGCGCCKECMPGYEGMG